jgi:hypothetical protein
MISSYHIRGRVSKSMNRIGCKGKAYENSRVDNSNGFRSSSVDGIGGK